ncbi:MAG: glycosyltransferase [Anaeromyxobacteraceae bacterium]
MTDHVFIVENAKTISHTFIRADIRHAEASGPVTVIDISEVYAALLGGDRSLADAVLGVLELVVTSPVTLMRCLVGGRARSNAKALLVYGALRREWAKRERCSFTVHFAAKAALVGTLLARPGRSYLRLVVHASDLYGLPRSMHFVLTEATAIETVTWFAKGFVFGRLGDAAIGKVTMQRNRVVPGHASDARRLESSSVGRRQLLTVARLATQKDLPFAIRVFAELVHGLGQDWCYRIAGEGPERAQLEAIARDLGVEDRVDFLGAVPNDEVRELCEVSAAFLLPCAESTVDDADGLPVVFQEALLAGCPVFCRSAFGVAELVVDGFNGRSFPVDATPVEWARAITSDLATLNPVSIRALARCQNERSVADRSIGGG